MTHAYKALITVCCRISTKNTTEKKTFVRCIYSKKRNLYISIYVTQPRGILFLKRHFTRVMIAGIGNYISYYYATSLVRIVAFYSKKKGF